MASTRYTQQPPLQIYQDPPTAFDHAPMPSGQKSTRPRTSSPLRPLKNAASRKNIIFNPPPQDAGLSKKPPVKSDLQTSSSPPRAPFGNKLNMIPMPPPGGRVYNTDSIEKKQPSMSKFKTAPQKALFTTFSSTRPMGKENYPHTLYPAPPNPYKEQFPASTFSLEGLYGHKPAPKRKLMEAAPIPESRPLKQAKTEDPAQEPIELPEPESFPELHDDGSKPGHSYAQLIGMSILRAPNRRLTLSQIYNWISSTYSYYSASEAGWQNSIRHNLSLNKAFIKQERPKEDPGKGNYWAIEPGMEHLFMKDNKARKPTPNENVSLSATITPATRPESSQPILLPAPQELPPLEPAYTQPEPQLPVAATPEISSDATIPASDALVPEEQLEEDDEAPTASHPINSSPPPIMHSSPPIVRHASRRDNTPPPVPRFPSSSRTRSRKRKFASMDDSGYFSSLDSSAMHPNRAGRLLTSEDRPRIKRGRAEEEIARLRGSSYDSPTKTRQFFGQMGFVPVSSSPLRRGYDSSTQMLPPLTPAVKLKAPVRPPQSVSPNTNLRMHRDRVRELVGSPVRGMTVLDEDLPWSPAFNLDDNSYMFDFNTDFDIFADTGVGLSIPANGSPEKRSAKRPRVDRSKSANILADISNTDLSKSVTSTPMLSITPKFTNKTTTSLFESPIKPLGLFNSPSKFLGLDSPSKMPSPSISAGNFDLPADDFLGAEFLAEDIAEFSGVDIMQGFQKIGGQASRNTPKGNSRQPFSRSFTSRF